MTTTPGDGADLTSRQRTRDQFELIQAAHDGGVIADTEDPADFTYICSSERILVDQADLPALQDYLGGRVSDFDGQGLVDPDQQPRDSLFVRYTMPSRLDGAGGDRQLLVTLDELDRDLGVGLARPDHLVHICPKGTFCPATEPVETGHTAPWPTRVEDPSVGAGVKVVVIDTGWYDGRTAPDVAAVPSQPDWEWLTGVVGEPEPDSMRDPVSGAIKAYSGHGTFIAGVIRSVALGTDVQVLSLPVDRAFPGGGVFESDMVGQLDAALTYSPALINLSAGCPTRRDLPARAFENWWTDVSARRADDPAGLPVLVAAAGNNASPWSFWPASFAWAVGVGSLDRDGRVSDFSNWGDSVDVFALGRNLVNAFPAGTYVCHESPDRGDVRVFDNWLARWSGTSFAAPLVTGMIAAAMTEAPGRSAAEARDHVLRGDYLVPALTSVSVPVVGSPSLAPRQP